MAGGRPRDPQLTDRVITVSTQILATLRLPGFTADEIAAGAGIGKASLYRRWPHIPDLLADVVADLGVRDIDYGDGPGDARSDLFKLLAEATTGARALAEAAVISQVGVDPALRQAYNRGPVVRFFHAADKARKRARTRGEDWPVSLAPLLVGWTSVLYQVATTGEQPNLVLLECTVDQVVLPALLAGQSVPA